MEDINSYQDRTYEMVPYDPAWPELFRTEEQRLKRILGDIKIEHVGSTAVPGMEGKATIDVLVILDSLSQTEPHMQELEKEGFLFAGNFVNGDSYLFRKFDGTSLFANIHVYPKGHAHMESMLAVRDFLRAHPEEAEQYSKFKRELYKKYPNDYGEYRRSKNPYQDVLRENATEWAKQR